MAKDYTKFFHFTVVFAFVVFVAGSFLDHTVMEFIKGFSTSLLIVAAFFHITKGSSNGKAKTQ